MTADFDFDDTPLEDDELEELDLEELEAGEEPAKKRSPLRIILLVLVILMLLCVVCFLGSRFLSIPSLPGLSNLPGIGQGQPTAPPAADTPTPLLPTEEAQLPLPEETEEPAPVPATEEPVAQELLPTEESQLPSTEEVMPTDEAELPPTEEASPAPTPTEESDVVPVPGPTSTPTVGPTVVITVEPSCDDNNPPVADAGGPYNAMIGKGQAVVTFDGSGSSDPDGTIESYEWDFGDGSEPGTGESVIHIYTSPGTYVVELTVVDDCNSISEDTTEVTILGPTPPATGTITPTPMATPQPPSETTTLGFCHLVQPGQTLSGIAAFYGVSWQILAEVNEVSMGYFVIAGQGLFIPTGEILPGSNVYEVQPGDTLDSVAYECGFTRTVLANANNLGPNDSLSPGQHLVIPVWRAVYP